MRFDDKGNIDLQVGPGAGSDAHAHGVNSPTTGDPTAFVYIPVLPADWSTGGVPTKAGAIWYDKTNNGYYIYDGAVWQLIGPFSPNTTQRPIANFGSGIVTTIGLSSQSTVIANDAAYPPPRVVGSLRINIHCHVTNVGTAGTLTPSITWKGVSGGTLLTATGPAISLTSLTSQASMVQMIYVQSNADPVTVIFTVAGATGSPAVYCVGIAEMVSGTIQFS